MAMWCPAHRAGDSSARSRSAALTFTTMRWSKSRPVSSPRYSCVGRAKQLWLTTPSAMKSPVPVVMSYIGMSIPSGSTATTFRRPEPFIARPRIDRFRGVAGSTARMNRIVSGSPPRKRTLRTPLGRAGSSTGRNPSRSSERITQSRISGSPLQIRTTWPRCPSASKIPARNPFVQLSVAPTGHAISDSMASTATRACVRIPRIDL